MEGLEWEAEMLRAGSRRAWGGSPRMLLWVLSPEKLLRLPWQQLPSSPELGGGQGPVRETPGRGPAGCGRLPAGEAQTP